MRAGLVVSVVGHVGAVLITLLAWETRSTFVPQGVATVPVDIVDVAPETNVRASAINPGDENTPPPPTPDQVEPTPAPPAPTPAATAPRPQRTAQQEQEEALRRAETGLGDTSNRDQARHRGPQGAQDQDAVGPGDANRASLEAIATSLIQRAMQRCWRMPADLPDPDRLVVTLRFRLNRNGTLSGQPEVTNPRNYQFDPAMGQAVQTALRAVRSCDFGFLPSDPRVGSHYEVWGENEYTFRPPT